MEVIGLELLARVRESVPQRTPTVKLTANIDP